MSVNRYKDGQLTLIAGSGDSNTFTGTKAEVEQAIAAGKIKENWTVYITDDLEDFVNTPGGSNCDCKVEYITQEDYDALPEDKLTNDIEYRITDNNPATPSAKNMAYDSSASGLEANNVQDAIDAVDERLDNIPKFQSGIVSIAGSSESTVIFPKEFTVAPQVFLQASGGVPSALPTLVFNSVTTSSFTVKNNHTSALGIYWLAVGK